MGTMDLHTIETGLFNPLSRRDEIFLELLNLNQCQCAGTGLFVVGGAYRLLADLLLR